jgi:signal transduction histidine kinase/CheY-like chemotaxis protein/HPt (histidine-containing phosphotransfer) domain-containing protein
MRHLIVVPVTRLTQHMLQIRNTGDLNQPFGSDRRDEIGLLANEFDQLATALGDAQSELETARDDALALSKAKGEFLARMSHEIRTPMNGVLGMIELLNNTPLADTQRRYAQTIHDSADTLLDVINDVLDFSKIESGKMRLESICFDLNSFLSDLVASLTGLAHGKGLAFELTLPDGTGLAVHGDPFRLRQVLTNLIGNAIKFTDEGTVSLCVTAADVDATHKEINFAVVDTGIGISSNKKDLIFESFAQEDGSTTRRFGGTGLGLSISKQLVGMMGSEIRVESEIGAGSSFSFSLCMEASNESDFSDSARALQKGLFLTKPKPAEIGLLSGRVLLAEDNTVNQEVAVGMMAAMGVEVVIAKNGDEAIRQFKSQKFETVLMDCQMPGVDGFDAARAIRKIEAETGQAPIRIIAVTAGAMGGDREQCIAAGMNDYLTKPFTGEQLYKALRKTLLQGGAKAEPDQQRCRNPVGAASNSPYSDSPVDQNVLDGLMGLALPGSQNLVHRVIRAYVENSNKLMTELRGEIESANADGIRASAHALKSSSANVGALTFSDMCRVMESAGEQKDLIQVEATWQQMPEEYNNVIEALKCRLKVAAA